MNQRFFRLMTIEFLTCAALVAVAGTAFAADDDAPVPDAVYVVRDDADADATARVAMIARGSAPTDFLNGDDYGTWVNVECAPASTTNGGDGTTLFVRTDHPDLVRLAPGEGTVAQQAKGNPAEMWVRTGGGSGTINVALACHAVSIHSSVQAAHGTARILARAEDCNCDRDVYSQAVCDGHEARLAQARSDCADNPTVRLRIDESTATTITDLRIRVAGEAVEQP